MDHDEDLIESAFFESTIKCIEDKEKLDENNKKYRTGTFPWDQQITDVLKTRFRYEDFRPNQRGIINATMSGKDCIGLIPTGGGKSITF